MVPKALIITAKLFPSSTRMSISLCHSLNKSQGPAAEGFFKLIIHHSRSDCLSQFTNTQWVLKHLAMFKGPHVGTPPVTVTTGTQSYIHMVGGGLSLIMRSGSVKQLGFSQRRKLRDSNIDQHSSFGQLATVLMSPGNWLFVDRPQSKSPRPVFVSQWVFFQRLLILMDGQYGQCDLTAQ